MDVITTVAYGLFLSLPAAKLFVTLMKLVNNFVYRIKLASIFSGSFLVALKGHGLIIADKSMAAILKESHTVCHGHLAIS